MRSAEKPPSAPVRAALDPPDVLFAAVAALALSLAPLPEPSVVSWFTPFCAEGGPFCFGRLAVELVFLLLCCFGAAARVMRAAAAETLHGGVRPVDGLARLREGDAALDRSPVLSPAPPVPTMPFSSKRVIILTVPCMVLG